MFGIKDLDVLKKLSSVLAIPLIVAAYFSDTFLKNIQDPLYVWANSLPFPILTFFGRIVWAFIVVFFSIFCYASLDYIVRKIDVNTDVLELPMILGIFLVAVGLMGGSAFVQGLPKSPLNIFWHLSFLCYGFSLLELYHW